MNRFSQYLERNNIRQEDIAGRLKITQPAVSRLVRGKTQPSPELAKRIEEETGGAVRHYDWPAFAPFAPTSGVQDGDAPQGKAAAG